MNATETMTTTIEAICAAHPFELAGMAYGPYKFIGIHDIAEEREHAAQSFRQPEHPKLTTGLGTCCNCGMGINIVCVVESADGQRWGVGSDCVLKTADKSLGNKVKVAIARRRAEKAAAKREASRLEEHKAMMAAPCTAKDALPGETNEAYTLRRHAEVIAAEAARQAMTAERLTRFADLVEVLSEASCKGNGFAYDMIYNLQRGPLTERQAHCTAKFLYKAGSKGHAELTASLMS
jgi:hypothetical protein